MSKKSKKAKKEVAVEEVVTVVEETVVEASSTEEQEWAEDTEADESEMLFSDEEASEETEESAETEDTDDDEMDLEGTELANFESAEIEDVESLTAEQIRSIVESVLFSTDKPQSVAVIKQAFKGTQVRSKDIREALKDLQKDYENSIRGFSLEEVGGGFQLRTKVDNMKYLRQSVKARPFKLSGPALEVLSIVAYKQPTTKAQIDEIRGVESGHLLRALMEKNLLTFGERSDLPGKPMYYETTKKFLEIFGLRNLQELPSLHEIDQLIPEGIGETEEKEVLSDLTDDLSQTAPETYSEGEEELLKITDELSQISTSSEFFEQEKQRMREKRDQERAQDIREALTVGEEVDEKDKRWLERYEASLVTQAEAEEEVAFVTEGEELAGVPNSEETVEANDEEKSVKSLVESVAASVKAFDTLTDDDSSEPEMISEEIMDESAEAEV